MTSHTKRVQLYVSPLSDVSTWGEEITAKADAVFRELYNEQVSLKVQVLASGRRRVIVLG